MQQDIKGEESVLLLENQSAGLYLLRVRVEDKVVVRRVMKA
jgi:hypothetical protein